MGKITFKAYPKQFANGSYLLLPATPADKISLDQFAEGVGKNYVTVTVNRNKGNKSYDQVKTVFALIDIRFFINHNRYPTDTEQAKEYSELLWKYADRQPVAEGSEDTAPVSLSEMSKSQAASFIGSIIAEIYEYMGDSLSDSMQVELKEIFEAFQAANGQGVGNPIDYDKDGNLLSMDEWREKNNFSFASGVVTEDLQLHHILTRGSKPQLADVAWNWIMLTEYEHMRIIHAKGGWAKFLELFPHCAPRIKNAYDMAKELYPPEIQSTLIKLGLIDEKSDTVVQKNLTTQQNLSFDDMEPVVKENLTTQLSACDDEFDLF